MAVHPRTNGGKVLRLACWNAHSVRGRKLELQQFLSEHGVDICLLNRTHLESGWALSFANYDCHRTHRPTRGGGTSMSVRNGLLLYTQFIRPTIDYSCPIWRSAGRSYIKKLQVLQTKCLRTTINAPIYVRNRKIHEDLVLPFLPTTSEL
jgi:hypothetical protein